MTANFETARAAWGDAMPDWVLALALHCDQIRSQVKVAARLGYSASAVNQLLNNAYKASTDKVEATIRGTLMAETVECPGLGKTINRAQCMGFQKRPFAPTSRQNVRLYRACRGACPHSFIGGKR